MTAWQWVFAVHLVVWAAFVVHIFRKWRANAPDGEIRRWSPLSLVPRSMRTWPVLRRWFWQQDEVDEIWRRARERAAAIDQWVDQVLDVIAEPDHRRAEHMNRALRRAEGGDEHG